MVEIKVINKGHHPLPAYATGQSAGMDLRACTDGPVTLRPMERRLIGTGLYISLPEGCEAQIRPRSGLALRHTHPILYSDLDVNGHLNNVRIAALVSDALDLTAHDFVRSLQINYTAETPAGLPLSLYAARTADTFRVRGEAAGKVRFEAAGTFGRLD